MIPMIHYLNLGNYRNYHLVDQSVLSSNYKNREAFHDFNGMNLWKFCEKKLNQVENSTKEKTRFF